MPGVERDDISGEFGRGFPCRPPQVSLDTGVAGLTAGIVHIFNHALAKGAVFLALAAFAMIATSLRMEDLKGVAKRAPLTFVGFVIAGLSLIGVPGTAGFISKWYLITAALELGPTGGAIVAIIVISSLMAVVYVWKVVEVAAFGEPDSEAPQTSISPVLVTVLWIAVIANVAFGLVPELPVSLANEASLTLLEHLQ